MAAKTSSLPDPATPEQLGAYLNKAPKTLANWRSRGVGPRARKVGHSVIYLRADVERWLDKQ